MSDLEPIRYAFRRLIQLMIWDLQRRSFDESGCQRAETEGRIEALKELLEYLNED
jgi:hypothetical protein